MVDAWSPAVYERFKQERTRPFLDVLELIEQDRLERAIDLGCGTGELTALAAERLGVTAMTGLDSSPAMLDEARSRVRPGLAFELDDIEPWTSGGDADLVLANASLQWVPNHARVLRRWTAALAPGGQIAVQVPANADHPSHLVASHLASSSEFADDFADGVPPDAVAANVLRPEEYAVLLYELGYDRRHVRLQVYGHVLDSTEAVVDWVSGTTLTRFRRVLPEARYETFVRRYRDELLAVLGERSPYFYPFKRILMWGRLPG